MLRVCITHSADNIHFSKFEMDIVTLGVDMLTDMKIVLRQRTGPLDNGVDRSPKYVAWLRDYTPWCEPSLAWTTRALHTVVASSACIAAPFNVSAHKVTLMHIEVNYSRFGSRFFIFLRAITCDSYTMNSSPAM